ncbi:C1 family peptidase [Flagellimonas flava]|uniref:Papain family cysteine protease n=1 Tax=Flagellimonas flava TaxID=570519 RepID=A0A1M5IQW6_9FLAO|nr:C1 family peptidase [Allomuricauda flava]SHG30707.1 Papain family cysteine protease [Allomuricauda flava]
MENPNLFFTPIEQIIGFENIKEIESIDESEFLSSFPKDWGPDRVVSLRDRDTPVKRQWNGTCTSFATTAAIENKLGGVYELSERSLWDFYGKASTSTAIRSAQDNFILEEEYWPQNQSRIGEDVEKLGRFRISKVISLKRDYLAVLKAIDKGNPCIVALSTPRDLSNGHKQVESSSKVSRRGGHAMCVSGYKVEKGRCYFLVKNSWGTKKGDGGYQYIAFDLYKSRKKRKRYCIFWEVIEIEEREMLSIRESSIEEIRPDFAAYWEFD